MYETWIERWNLAFKAAQSRGADSRLEISPPATENALREIELTIGVSIPPLFRTTLLEFSRKVDFYWFLNRDDNPPAPLSGIFCGGCRWDVDHLIDIYEEVSWLSRNAFVEETPYHKLWRETFPFHLIGNGDFIAIDQASTENQRVVYLNHESDDGPIYWLGSDFYDFMNRWTVLGCPDDDIWSRFVRDADHYIDLHHPNAIKWCEWFGMPRPNDG